MLIFYRHLIVTELQKYMDIDIYGNCLKNKEIPDWAYKYGMIIHPSVLYLFFFPPSSRLF